MNNLKKLRDERNLSIRELGELTKISYSTISYMENGIRPFTQANLEILCSFFDVSADYLLGKTDVRKSQEKSDNKHYTSTKQLLNEMIDSLTDEEAVKALEYIEFIREKNKKNYH